MIYYRKSNRRESAVGFDELRRMIGEAGHGKPSQSNKRLLGSSGFCKHTTGPRLIGAR
jgi:hypothetical protein